MTRRLAWALLAAAVVLGAAALVVASRRDRPEAPGGAGVAVADDADVATEPARLVRVELYFPGADGRLAREPRDVPYAADASVFAAHVVEALLEGPHAEPPPYRPFSSEVTLGEVHVDEDGVAYVDLRSAAHASPPYAGTTAEMLALYSLVNSVIENVEGATALVVLWNGRQPRTFGGHLDTSRPLKPARQLEAS